MDGATTASTCLQLRQTDGTAEWSAVRREKLPRLAGEPSAGTGAERMTRHPSARIQARSHPRAALWLGPPVAPELCAGLCAESGCRGIRNLVLSMWREKRQPHERKPVLAGHPTTPSRPPCRCGGRSSTVRAANVTRGGRNNSARAGVSPADGRHSDRRRTAERPPTDGRATPDVRQSERRTDGTASGTAPPADPGTLHDAQAAGATLEMCSIGSFFVAATSPRSQASLVAEFVVG